MKLRYDMLTQGVYIVTAAHGGRRAGMALAWATQAEIDHICVCLGSQSHTRKLILASRAFGFNVLGRGQQKLAGRFGSSSSAKADKFRGISLRTARTGSPILGDCVAWLDCRVAKVVSAGKGHKLILGKVVACGRGRRRAAPLVYRQEDY